VTGLILRRLRALVVVLLLVGTAMFFIIHLIPGSPAITMLGPSATHDQVTQLTASLGLNKPLIVQYGTWLGHAVRGDLGNSISFSQPVSTVIAQHAEPTIVLALASTIISAVISVPLAVRAAAKPHSIWSRLVTPVTAFGLALPSFWLALILVYLFGVTFQLLPTSG
jgi:peptide/nickel transport system permease protein